LYHLQILLFNLQDTSPLDNVSSSYTLWLNLRQYNNNDHIRNAIIVCAVTVITVSYKTNDNPPSFNNNNNDGDYFGGVGEIKLIDTLFQFIDHRSALMSAITNILQS